MEISVELESYPMRQHVDRIEDKHIILPNINIGLQDSKFPEEIGNKPFSSGVNSSKTYPSIYRKSVLFAITSGIYLIECSFSKLLV